MDEESLRFGVNDDLLFNQKRTFVYISEKDTLDVWINGQKMETAVSIFCNDVAKLQSFQGPFI